MRPMSVPGHSRRFLACPRHVRFEGVIPEVPVVVFAVSAMIQAFKPEN
jgi:hypothetical protein